MKPSIFVVIGFLFFFSCESKKEISTIDSIVPLIEPTLIMGIGRVEPEQKIIKLSSEVNGIVYKVNCQAGDRVKKGDVLLELTHSVEDAQVQVSRAQFNTRQADLNTLKASVEAATIKMENAKLRFARTKNLAEQGAENKQQLENVQTEYASAQKEVERLQASLQTAQMQLQELQSQILLNQFQTSRKIIRAPQDGMVLSMDLSPGAAVQAMSSVAEFAPAGYTSVLAEIDELFADQITTGMKASIRKQGQLDTVASGQIIFTSPFLKKKSLFSEGGDLEDRRVREIRIRLDSTGLLFGSRVECIIQNNP